MSATPPNVVLVSVDSLRADHCGYLGDDRGLTPTLDDMASEGIAFRNAIAPGPQTFSSVPVSFTGSFRSPDSVERAPGESHWERRLAAIDAHLGSCGTIPEYLGDLGYTTAAFSPNPWTSRASGFDRGFDHFADVSGAKDDGRLGSLVDRLPGIDADRHAVRLLGNLITGRSFFARWESFYDDLLAVRDRLEEPYFLWVFLLDTHFPFLTSRRHRVEQSLPGMYYSIFRAEEAMRRNTGELSGPARAAVERTYRDSVRAADAFLATLRRDFAADDPVVIVHSDHGEAFGEHGNYGHTGEVFEENIHVPYVVANADVRADVDAPTSLATLPDTVLTLARGERLDPTATSRPYAVASSEYGTYRAVRGRRFKYVERGDERALFDLHRDPHEHADVSAEHESVRRTLRRRLDRFGGHLEETARVRSAAESLARSAPL